MKKQNKNVQEIKKKILPILKESNVKKAGIFGSYARGEQREDSDVDIIVKVDDKGFSLLDLVKLKMTIQKVIKKEVDLVEYSTIHPLIKEQVLKEEVQII